jgi:hypothetical protein
MFFLSSSADIDQITPVDINVNLFNY